MKIRSIRSRRLQGPLSSASFDATDTRAESAVTRPLAIEGNVSDLDMEESSGQLVPYRKTMILCLENADEKARELERVEVVVTYRKGERILKIIPIPEAEAIDDVVPGLVAVDSCDDSVLLEEDPYTTRETSFLEELARQVLDPCQCQTFLKPALRKQPRDPALTSRSVSFDKVDIKEFPMTLGDHPSAASGPPIALDWEKVERERCVGLDEYEASRTPRRNRKQLKLSLRDRKGILQRQFSADEVNKAWREARAIREQRKETIQRGFMMMMVDDILETANRRVGKISDSLSRVVLCGS